MHRAKHFRRIVLLTAGIPILQVYGQIPVDTVLENTTIAITTTITARNSITAGPNFTIDGTAGDVIFRAGRYVYFRSSPSNPSGGVLIIQGGKRQMVMDPTLVSVRTLEAPLPTKFSLQQNYPNPFNPSTSIRYELPVRSVVMLEVFDLLGRSLGVLVDGLRPPGVHQVEWNSGNAPSGIYFVRMTAGTFVESRKLLLAR
ncbi:MAG: T9SS type A sorting domain-containing protein [Bacteroidota bacterium]